MAESTQISMAQTNASPEESGWTSYFDEFFSDNRDYHSSLVSDAASCAHLRFLNHDHSSFKKRKTTYASFDDDLEDTASSPASSPKVSDLKHSNMNSRNRDGNIHLISQKREQEKDRKGFNMEEENEYTELKKRGLCLVSMSMLVNYLG